MLAPVLRELEANLDKDLQETIARRTLESLNTVDPARRKRLGEVISATVVVRGFRNPLLAPVSLLAREVARAASLNQSLLAALVDAWVDAVPKLAAVGETLLTDYLASIKESVQKEFNESLDGVSRLELVPEPLVERMVRETGCSVGEARLLLCGLFLRCLEICAGEAAAEEETGSDESEASPGWLTGSLWNEFLDRLRALPAEAEEWNSLDKFVAVVQKLSAEKAAQRQGRQNFEEALRLLWQECKEDLRYFGMEEAKRWEAERVPAERWAELAPRVAELRRTLLRHRELRLSPSATIAEDRARREELFRLEGLAEEIFRHLDQVLRPVSKVPLEDDGAEQTGPDEKCEAASIANRESDAGIPTPSAAEEERLAVEAAPSDEPAFASPTERPEEAHVELEKVADGASPRTWGTETPVAGPATTVIFSEGASTWEGLLWRLLSADDLAGGYWLIRSLETRGYSPPVPAWLVQALQGARWLEPEATAFVADLAQIARSYQPAGTEVQELLGLAAALRPAVIAPNSGMLGWLKAPRCYPGLNGLVETVRDYAHLGRPLRRIDLQGVTGAEEYDLRIRAVVEEARKWLEEAPRRRTKLARATNVWIEFTSKGAELRVMLESVADDLRARWAEVRELAARWRERRFIEQRIVEIDRNLIGRKIPPITGDPREKIIRNVQEACNLALRWCEMVERQQEDEARGKEWLVHRITALRNGIQASIPELKALVNGLADQTDSLAHLAAAVCLGRALHQLCADLNIEERVGPPSDPTLWSWLTAGVEEMNAALIRRLILLPQLDLTDAAEPTAEALTKVAEVLMTSSGSQADVRAAIEAWLNKNDFRFVPLLLSAVEDGEKRMELARHCEEKLSGFRAALDDALQRTRHEIEQAVVDGILSGEERAALMSNLQDIDAGAALNFPAEYAKLEKVRGIVGAARRARLQELREEWSELQRRLVEYPGDAEKKSEIVRAVDNALEREDAHLVGEYMAQLTQLMEAGDPLSDYLFEPASERGVEVLERFVELSPRLATLLEEQGMQPVKEAIRHDRHWGGLNLTRLPRNVRDEALAAIEAWRRLKQGTGNSPDSLNHMVTILRYLGFNIDRASEAAIDVRERNENLLHARVAMSVGNRSPVPQFGSQQQGVYDVVCVWGRPSVDALTGWLRDIRLQNRNVLVIYLGRMSLRHRLMMRQVAGDRGFVIIVLDEVLLTFLTAEWRERLPHFFRCALPFGVLNPYTPFRAGDVPREMFFGREDMARELQLPEGSCIVYGGRQLGKSALLRHVQREFHDPERGQYAWVEDIKLVGSPDSDQQPAALWIRLREIFKGFGLLSPDVTSEKGEVIAKLIEEVLQKHPHYRVLILFDEADNFLDADSKNNFKVVDELRILMGRVQRRLKVVLAGLHNVQRFQGRGNQPLAHFGTPLCVGPLEPQAAQKLVQWPLAALGYRFADNSAVLSILSYTNYHPGLIQLFCHELLNRLNQRHLEGPPYIVTREDVEAIYRNQHVQDSICERFNWTLALDPRYQAIAWSMILDQGDRKDGFSHPYAPGELLSLARQWWPQGFEGIDTDQLRGLLDEMCGLGVLVRDRQGYYRLRSPNLVRLMKEVESSLLDLSYREPETRSFDPESYHAPLGGEGFYSPLTYAQETRLNQQRFGVGIVFGSDALGLPRIGEALKRLIPEELVVKARADLSLIPPGVADPARLTAWLEEYLLRHRGAERLVLYYQPTTVDTSQIDAVRAAVRFCQRFDEREQGWFRIVFAFGPELTWRSLSLSETERLSLENEADVATCLRRWNLRAIRQRLAQQDKLHFEEVCQEVLYTTGGWPYLLDELLRRCGAEDDPRHSAQEICEELGDPGSPLFLGFWRSLGIEINSSVRKTIEFICYEGGIPAELAEPREFAELIHTDVGLSLEECEACLIYLQRMGLTEVARDGTLTIEPVVGRMLQKL